jgi:outer membrane protein assembly factor BamB
MAETTYLELSEEGGGSHKFYEVTVDGTSVTARYGRIGDAGQTQSKTYPSAEKAKADAEKKINEKLRKGYEKAVQGVRKKRTVTRREIVEVAVSKRLASKQAPVLWKFASGDRAFGISVSASRAWVGNQEGRVFSLDHEGQVLSQYRLPDGVKCIIDDEGFLYAGCDDGNVYDLTGKLPHVAYRIAEDVDIFWLDVKDGVLAVSDGNGGVTAINHEDESQWTKKSDGTAGWMVRCDEIGVYHGHSGGVTMYDWEDGRRLWHAKTDGLVLFGWQEESAVYAGTSGNVVQRFTKKGQLTRTYKCDGTVFSCAAAGDGKYVFAGDNSGQVYCFDGDGKRLWKLSTGCGSAYSMQYFQERLYVVTTDGSLACIDASEAAIAGAEAGTVPERRDIKAPKPVAAYQPAAVETTSDSSGGVVVECYREGGQLRVRPVSAGYRREWNVQFPKDIREAGARYLVEELRESARGRFYRAYGDIKKLV